MSGLIWLRIVHLFAPHPFTITTGKCFEKRLFVMIIRWRVLLGAGLASTAAMLAGARLALVVVTVQNRSMAPTLQPGDRVLVLRRWPARWLCKGMIVIVAPESEPRTGAPPFGVRTPFIKRVIGLPGEQLSLPMTQPDDPAPTENSIWSIPPAHFFVRGDNRSRSIDSCTWGPLPYATLLGLVTLRLPGATRYSVQECPTSGLQIGQPAPDFTATDLHGTPTSLAAYAGRAVLLLFLSLDLIIAEQRFLQYQAIAIEAGRHGVACLLVFDTDRAEVAAFAAAFDVQVPVLAASAHENAFLHRYQITGLPAFCLIDRAGCLTATGYPTRECSAWSELVADWELTAVDEEICRPTSS